MEGDWLNISEEDVDKIDVKYKIIVDTLRKERPGISDKTVIGLLKASIDIVDQNLRPEYDIKKIRMLKRWHCVMVNKYSDEDFKKIFGNVLEK